MGDVGEGQRAALRFGAVQQVVAAGVEGLPQGVPDDRQVSDPLLDLGELVGGSGLQARGPAAYAVSMGPRLEQLGHLGEREPEPLGGLDHPEQSHRLRRVEPVPTQAAVRPGQQTAALVVPQGLDV